MTSQERAGTVAVIGAGTMGRGIVQTLAGGGYAVRLFDQSVEAAEAGAAFAAKMLARAAEKGTMKTSEAEAAKARITVVREMAELAPADVVIEAVAEVLEVKQALFAEVERLLPDDTVLATNTSSLSISAVAAGVQNPGRVVGLHFFNPVPLMRVVEIIPGLRTDAFAKKAALKVAERIGYRAILCRDAPGFLINHAGRGLMTEGVRIVQEGLAEEVDVDRVMREGCGFRMGPFELLDLTGLDVSLPVMRLIYEQFYHEPRYRPGVHLAARVASGLYGRKSRSGFYDYEDGRRREPPETEPDALAPSAVWAPQEMRADLDAPLRMLAEAGVRVIDAATPPDEGVLLVAPWGEDATAVVCRLGLDAARTVALDPLTAERDRLTLMATPATDPTHVVGMHAALVRAGRHVTAMGDGPGFIAQRVLASIVNIGCEIAQMRIASPADIDDGVRIGLGYPAGPLTLGDRIGPARVLEILVAMQAVTGDPRYRPSSWLRQRAMLGQPLGVGGE